MDYLEKLTIEYLKKRPRNLLSDIRFAPDEETEGDSIDLFLHKLRRYSNWAIDNKMMHTYKEIKAMDTIDFSSILNNPAVKSSDLPSFQFTDYERNQLNACWYLLIPPFKEGVLRINKHRYVKWEVYEVNEADHSYRVILYDYARDKVWMLENLAVGYIGWNNEEPTGKKFKFQIDGDTMYEIVNRHLFEEGETKGWSKDDLLYFKIVAVPYLKSVTHKEDDLDSLLAHFAGLMVKTNVQLLSEKPKAVRGSGNKIKTEAGEIDRNPKPRIVRTLSNGLIISSIKIPKSASPDTIRKYHIEAWRSRGHIRRYKNGKTTYVRESIHHRKCLANDEKSIIPQTIIKVE